MSARSHPAFDAGQVVDVPLHDATRSRFLNYAVSVITARALPDVRDGLKPVQRRILYTMHHDLHLAPEKPTLKCAKVVGQVLGNYHPHGDSAVYEAMVRMAQPWALRYPLVFGQGNFGSIDGDSAAAYRYTEARLQPAAMEFVAELGQETVDFRPNFDESQQEPVVLPARLPQLLINGSTGIAVGVATNIPPHNIGEVLKACEALVDRRDLPTEGLMEWVKGPDFPTGGEILESRQDLLRVYEEGQGPVRVRGQYVVEEEPRKGPRLVITSIPYQVNKSRLVEEIGQVVMEGKVPQLQDVRDESTDEVRVVLECQKGTDPEVVMAYLYKHTALQSIFHVNMTCLTPRGPERVGLRTALLDFLDFRFQVTVRRLRHEVRLLNERIHILDGFVRVFDGLDEALQIIRESDGRKPAGERLMERFDLDQIQADAVLDLRLYRLGRPDVLAVRRELDEKRARLLELQVLLGDERALWNLVRDELRQVREKFADARRTRIVAQGVEELSYQVEDFILEEQAQVLLTRDGWIRRTSPGADLGKLRMRQDDEIVAILPGSNLASVVFFTSSGTAYTMRIHDVPVSARGYGDPVQKFFNFGDGDRVVAAMMLDPRDTLAIRTPDEEGALPPVHALAVAEDGKGLRFSLESYAEPSTRSGRRYARAGSGVAMAWVEAVRGDETVVAISREGRALLCPVSEINFLSGPGKGVTVLKLESGDRVVGVAAVRDGRDGLTVVREEGGRPIEVTPRRYRVTSRGGKGTPLIKRGRLRVVCRGTSSEGESGSEAPQIVDVGPERLQESLFAEEGQAGSSGEEEAAG
jgi:DNA gyrase subunit A